MLKKKLEFIFGKEKVNYNLSSEIYQKLHEEYEIGQAEFITQDIRLFDEPVDLIVQNPPFGTKQEHADKIFLEKAFTMANLIYTMHKYSTKEFLEAISHDNNFQITHFYRYDFPINATFKFHEKPVVKIDVGLWRLEKK